MMHSKGAAAIKLDVQLPVREFVEGSVIDLAVRGVVERDLTVAGGQVDLIRTVTYRYRNRADEFSLTPARSAEVVTRRVLPAGGRYLSGEQLYETVCLDVPADGPGSVTGDLVRVQWAVRAHLRVEPSGDAEATRKVVVFSRASDRAWVQRTPPVWQDRRCAVLAFESLSSRRLVPGSWVSGVLTVAPRRAASARGIRVELVLREQVHHGPWIGDDPSRNPCDQSTEKDTVVATTVLAGGLQLDPIQPLWLPFALPVPPRLPAPSLQTPEFTLSWVLRGVLDRALRPDPYVDVELRGVTTPG